MVKTEIQCDRSKRENVYMFFLKFVSILCVPVKSNIWTGLPGQTGKYRILLNDTTQRLHRRSFFTMRRSTGSSS